MHENYELWLVNRDTKASKVLRKLTPAEAQDLEHGQLEIVTRPPQVGGVTERQGQALHAIQQLVDQLGRAPHTKELAEKIGCGKSAAHDHVVALRLKGFLAKGRGSQVSIELTEKGRAYRPAVNNG